MNKKIVSIITVITISVSILSGCNSDAEYTSKQSGLIQETEKPKSSETDANAHTDSVSKEEKTIIKQEDYPDCDGSGHGYTEITYSDGSTETVEY